MRIVLSDAGVSLEGWVEVARAGRSASDVQAGALEFLDARSEDIDELLIVGSLERGDPQYARALLGLAATRLPVGTPVTVIVPDAAAAFAALDDGEATAQDLAEWYDAVFGSTLDPWCAGAVDAARVADEAGLGPLEIVDMPVGMPPGLTAWRLALRVGMAGAPAPAAPGDPDEVMRRLRRLGDARRRAGAGDGPPALEVESAPMSRARAALERYLPRGGKRRALARSSVDALRETQDYFDRVQKIATQSGLHEPGPPAYRRWCRTHDATSEELADQRALSQSTRDPVTVHCVVTAHGSWGGVRATLESLRQQSWAHWRATVVGGGAGWSRSDARVTHRRGNGADPAALVNEALADPDQRSLVLFLEAGDKLAPDACFRIADTVETDPLIDLVYWDDDLVDAGRRADPQFRPSWSPEMLLGANYLGRSFAIRRRLVVGVAGLTEGLGDDAWWDLLLRADLTAERVARIPRVLSHLRRRPDAIGPHGAGVVSSHLARIGAPARAVSTNGCVRVEWDLPEWPHVTMIVPTRHNRDLLTRSLRAIGATDYPSFDVLVVDNGGRTDERVAWYEESFADLALEVEWWDDDFNYSGVNNAAACKARGDVLVFVNDDTDFPDPGWLYELVGWAAQPDVGVAGLQLIGADGTIQHGGVILGLNGFADHLFEGLAPGEPSLIGPTTWYRNVLAVTAACLGIRRALFEELGGFDERFRLCGGDVVLGLDAVIAGKRNVCSPFGGVRHLESATRGSYVPREDFFASYWRYQRWIFAGDPYFSPSLSLGSRIPKLHARFEQSPADRLAEPLSRQITIFRQSTDEGEVDLVARGCRVTDSDVAAIRTLHSHNAHPFAPKTVNWFLPELDSPFYGGINTALRMADHLGRVHGVENRFVLWAHPNDGFHRSAIAAAFPSLGDSPIYYDLSLRAAAGIPACDVSISTLWVTAYVAAHFANARRKFYLVQDFEPMFYPAGTMYALAEESYRLGLYGLCNTENLLHLYENYGGRGTSFVPAVDRSVFHAVGRRERHLDDPVTVFVYARPGHWRNCWELASLALQELKSHLGDRVRIVTAGSWARPEDVGTGIQHLGLLDYRETGNLYRTCDVGVALTVSEHPSYLPLELMACGVPVVAFDNPAGYWLLRDRENCLLARRTVDGLSRQLERIVVDHELRASLAERGLRDIDEGYASWDKSLSGIYEFLSDPEGMGSG